MASTSIAFILRKREREPLKPNECEELLRYFEKNFRPDLGPYYNDPRVYSSYTERDKNPRSKTNPKHIDE